MKTLTLIFGAFLLVNLSASAVNYSVTILENFPNSLSSYALGINDSNQVVGQIQSQNGEFKPVLWNGALVTQIGEQWVSGQAIRINNSGQVVGSFIGSDGFTRPFSYTPQILSTIGGGQYGHATGINDSGIIVGVSQSQNLQTFTGFRLEPPSLQSLGSFKPSDINNQNYTVGQSNSGYAYLQTNTQTINLGFLGGDESLAERINENNQVVGWAETNIAGIRHAFLFENGVLNDIGTLNNPSGYNSSYAKSINDLGQVVGYSDVNGRNRGFLYADGLMLDINNLIIDPSLEITALYDINNSGSIVGTGIDSFGNAHAVLLTVIPEPSAISLLIISSILLISCKRRD